MKKIFFVFGILMVTLATGCLSQTTISPTAMMAAQTPTSEAMMTESTATTEVMMPEDTATSQSMMTEATHTPEAMMSTAMPGTGEMMTGTATTPAMMSTTVTETMMMTGTPSAMTGTDWLGTALSDVNTGKTFKLSDYAGKTVLVEIINTQSAATRVQQKSIQALTSGASPDLQVVSLDISPAESMDVLKSHAEMNHFNWAFASAPATLVQEIGKQYGSQYTEVPNLPLLVIDPKEAVHALPLNLQTMNQISAALAQYLPKM